MGQIQFKMLSASAIEVLEARGVLGDMYDALLAKACKVSDYSGVSLYVHGRIRVSRLDGKANGGGKPYEWNPGEFSKERPLPAILSPGTFRFEVISDSALYYCVRRKDRTPLNLEVVRATAGETISVHKGEQLFIASGSASAKDSVVSAPRLVNVASSDLDFKVITDVFGLILRDG